MKLSELLATKPDNLAERQYTALVDYVEFVFAKISQDLRKGELPKVKEQLMNSPAGDCNGTEKYFIDFSETGIQVQDNSCSDVDLFDIVSHLEKLRKQIPPQSSIW